MVRATEKRVGEGRRRFSSTSSAKTGAPDLAARLGRLLAQDILISTTFRYDIARYDISTTI